MKRKTRAKFTVLDSARKSIRASTAIKTQATKIRLKEMDDARRKKKKVVKVEEYMPTQEELLEEAKITEEENIKSLGRSVMHDCMIFSLWCMGWCIDGVRVSFITYKHLIRLNYWNEECFVLKNPYFQKMHNCIYRYSVVFVETGLFEDQRSLHHRFIKPRAELALLTTIDMCYRKCSLGSKNVSWLNFNPIKDMLISTDIKFHSIFTHGQSYWNNF